MFCESRIEALVPQLKSYAEARIEEKLGGSFRLTVGNIDGGILHPIVLNDVKIKGAKASSPLSSLVISQVRTNYRIWNVLLASGRAQVLYGLFQKDSSVYLNFSTRDSAVEGFAQLKGDLARPEIKGYLNLFNKEKLDFSGKIEKGSFDIEIKPPVSGAIKCEGVFSRDGALVTNIKASHLVLCGMDIVFDATSRNRFVNSPSDPKNGILEGEIETHNLIINFKPFLDMKAVYRVSSGVLEIGELNLGDNLMARGKVFLREPYNIDALMTANNINLGWFMTGLGVKDPNSVLTGTMNGRFDFKGPVKRLKSNIHMEIKKGTIATLDFNSLTANLKGDGPYIRIEESRIARESGYFALEGEMDIRKAGKISMFDDIRMATDEKAITWDGWNSSRMLDIQEIRMKKKISDNLNLDFKKIVAEEKIDESLRDNDEIRLEYKLDAKDSLKMMMGTDNEFFGLEHKDTF